VTADALNALGRADEAEALQGAVRDRDNGHMRASSLIGLASAKADTPDMGGLLLLRCRALICYA
jgi:hypothetical protein